MDAAHCRGADRPEFELRLAVIAVGILRSKTFDFPNRDATGAKLSSVQRLLARERVACRRSRSELRLAVVTLYFGTHMALLMCEWRSSAVRREPLTADVGNPWFSRQCARRINRCALIVAAVVRETCPPARHESAIAGDSFDHSIIRLGELESRSFIQLISPPRNKICTCRGGMK